MDDSGFEHTGQDPVGTRNAVLSKLFTDYHHKLFHFVLSRVRSADDSADLVDQAFAEACKAFGTFRGDSEMRTWLYGIAMNLVRNHMSRSPHRKYEFGTDEGIEELAQSNENVMQSVENGQVIARLQCHIDELAPHLSTTLMLVAIEDLSYEDAAARLGIPVGTVRSRVSRARSLLRERLSEEGIFIDDPQG